MKQNKYPAGWNPERVQQVLAHYELQTEEEAVAEDEAALADEQLAMMEIPLELVPVVRALLAKYYGDQRVPA